MNSQEIIEKLNGMKDELMARGWGQKALENEKDGTVCLLGARNIVMYGSSLQEETDEGYSEDGPYVDGYRSDELSAALIEALKQDPQWKEVIENPEGVVNPNSAAHIYLFNDNADSFNEVLDLIDQAIIIQKES